MVRFENATVELKNGKLMTYTNDGATEIEIPEENAYVNELVDFICCIRKECQSSLNRPASSMLSIEIALAEKLSADKKEKIIL